MRRIGYGLLVERYGLRVCGLRNQSWLWEHSQKQEKVSEAGKECFFPESFWKAKSDDWAEHLRFAFRYEGIHLEVLHAFFEGGDEDELVRVIQEQPVSGFSRRLAFCYEFLTGKQLPIPDLHAGNYVELLNPEIQIPRPREKWVREKRFRIVNNLLGGAAFCPIVYRTKELDETLEERLKQKVDVLLESYPPEIVLRANQYLFLKETRSSFAIERETADQRRIHAFVQVLRGLSRVGTLTKETLLAWQHQIVDPRYQATDWRKEQVYVGDTLSPSREWIHYIAPKPEDVPELMEGWLECARLLSGGENGLIAAAVLSFAFVFIHPFFDGNGRIHRLLMHYFLARKGLFTQELVFPVSVIFLNHPSAYDAILESFSDRLMSLVEYETSDRGEVTVQNETLRFYQYIDFTAIAERFVALIFNSLEKEWASELQFLQAYDTARMRMREVVDMPEKKVQQWIRFTLQNGGTLSKSKRPFFSELTEAEIESLEAIVSEVFGGGFSGSAPFVGQKEQAT